MSKRGQLRKMEEIGPRDNIESVWRQLKISDTGHYGDVLRPAALPVCFPPTDLNASPPAVAFIRESRQYRNVSADPPPFHWALDRAADFERSIVDQIKKDTGADVAFVPAGWFYTRLAAALPPAAYNKDLKRNDDIWKHAGISIDDRRAINKCRFGIAETLPCPKS